MVLKYTSGNYWDKRNFLLLVSELLYKARGLGPCVKQERKLTLNIGSQHTIRPAGAVIVPEFCGNTNHNSAIEG